VDRPAFKDLPLVPLSCLVDEYPPEDFEAHVALSYKKMNRTRDEKYHALKRMGYRMVNYICTKSVTWPDLQVGDNCFILENQTIQPTVKIGSDVIIWSGNHLGHRGVIGDHTYISSHVCIAGFVTVGTHCFIGINATIRDFVKIGNRVFIGMGASVVGDVPDDAVVVGSRGTIFPAESETAIAVKKKYMNL
jgi:sugar O-acyltransferase (sialic acid O-acetyltransferase NeuD family)